MLPLASIHMVFLPHRDRSNTHQDAIMFLRWCSIIKINGIATRWAESSRAVEFIGLAPSPRGSLQLLMLMHQVMCPEWTKIYEIYTQKPYHDIQNPRINLASLRINQCNIETWILIWSATFPSSLCSWIVLPFTYQCNSLLGTVGDKVGIWLINSSISRRWSQR